MKILLLCSSSGGHINPCVSFGRYLENKGVEVKYLGFKDQMEEKIIEKEKLITINSPNSFKKTIRNPLKIIPLIKEIKKYRKLEFDCIVGFGGFITLIGLFLKKKKPFFIHEQNYILGDSNKICRLFSKKIFYSFENKDKKGIVVGNPSSDNINKKAFNYKNRLNILFVFGSLGSSSLIEKLILCENELNNNHKYTLVTGSKLYNQYKNKFDKILVREYISLKNELMNYDLVFSRGGATSLYEIISSNTYCVSVPSPYVKNNHQEKNVDYLVSKNLVNKLREKDFNINNINKKIDTYYDFDYCLSRYQNMNSLSKTNASEKMYNEIIKYVKD